MKFPVRARTLKYLSEMAQPTVVPGGNSEALAWTMYDTAQYTSGATTQLTFFGTTRVTPQLSNLQGSGLPTPQYFEIFFFNLDLFAPAGDSPALQDTWAIYNGTGVAGLGGPTWAFILADKTTGPFPLTTLHSLGGLQGFTTRTAVEYGQSGNSQGSFATDGGIIIPPNQNFSIQLTWPAAVTLAANRDIRASFTGVLHRRIL